MTNRLELQQELEKILGARHVYFQPPENIKMTYPAIVYTRKSIDTNHANNHVYTYSWRYELILIDKNPESEFINKILFGLPHCLYDRHYTADNLNHEVFTVYI